MSLDKHLEEMRLCNKLQRQLDELKTKNNMLIEFYMEVNALTKNEIKSHAHLAAAIGRIVAKYRAIVKQGG